MKSPFFPERGSCLVQRKLSDKSRHQALVSAGVKKLEAACLEAIYSFDEIRPSYYGSEHKRGNISLEIPTVEGVEPAEYVQPVVESLKILGIRAEHTSRFTLFIDLSE